MSRYTIQGAMWPSVTEILGTLDKPALQQWAVNCACQYIRDNICDYDHDNIETLLTKAKSEYRNVSKDSLDIGSEVHHAIEMYIKYGADKVGYIRDEVASALVAFWEWEKAHNVQWIESEQAVLNECIGYAGTLDAIAVVDGIVTCIDFKSSKAIYDEYLTQVAAYKSARESMCGKYTIKSPTGDYIQNIEPITIDAIGILRLDKETGMPEWKHVTDSKVIAHETAAFNALVNYWYLAKNRRLKNNPVVKKYDTM